ncbi:TPA: hypothetical protein DD449_03565 [Candidatus Berkelbacteria bacterium]|uniref:Uncharacterized protein n=1 Tax=Berkelbacteria bacterium GW2011_GWE1_39_12 TaxID=1618337 RepID=A0A0G4B3K7_9BACT|nr:MAG: hypothetical protein UT28_C0001G0346 [Berkelbacteria bacterium GW2011_GWE1_39_12]HBO60736.1 hypothetical protein [Candidatus Berkelbacteria bacterium]
MYFVASESLTPFHLLALSGFYGLSLVGFVWTTGHVALAPGFQAEQVANLADRFNLMGIDRPASSGVLPFGVGRTEYVTQKKVWTDSKYRLSL